MKIKFLEAVTGNAGTPAEYSHEAGEVVEYEDGNNGGARWVRRGKAEITDEEVGVPAPVAKEKKAKKKDDK